MEVEAADVDGLDKTDVAPPADDDLASPGADVHQHVDVVFIFLAADETFEAAINGAGFDIEGLDDGAGAVEVLDQGIDVVVLGGHQDDFLANLGSLPDFAGGKKVNPGLVGIEGENVAGLEADDRGQFRRGHLREAQVFHVYDLARQRRDDLAAAKGVLAEHLADQLG